MELRVHLHFDAFNGFINGYCWSGLALHYKDMGWSISRSALAGVIGFGLRPFLQQLQLRMGFWVAVPIGIIHLAATIAGIIYPTEEWAVVLEISAAQAMDIAITIEGIAFAAFGESETMAQQASSTVLGVSTTAIAGSVTIGGVLYDTLGWQSTSVFHLACQVSSLLLLVFQPVVFKSFKMKWFKAKSEQTELQMVDAATATTLGAVDKDDLQVEDIDLPGAVKDEGDFENPRDEGRTSQIIERNDQMAVEANQARNQGSQITYFSIKTRESGLSHVSSRTLMSGDSASTCRTALTARSRATGITSLTSFKDSDGYQHLFGANGALLPTIAQPAGLEMKGEEKASKQVPPDLWVPVALIVLCFFNNLFSQVIEFATFAIYFKEYHGWESATWASLAQSGGDLMAIVMMKVLPNKVDDETEDVEDVGFLKRCVMQPYDMCSFLLGWILCNLGMVSPWLPIAVTAQVLMGTVFHYAIKSGTDLNVFYSFGDSDLYVRKMLYCKNAEALGGCAASLAGPLLYDNVGPIFPFVVSTCTSSLVLIIFLVGFGRRIGWDDIETAEQKRSRRLCLDKLSQSSEVSRKSTVVIPAREEI